MTLLTVLATGKGQPFYAVARRCKDGTDLQACVRVRIRVMVRVRVRVMVMVMVRVRIRFKGQCSG